MTKDVPVYLRKADSSNDMQEAAAQAHALLRDHAEHPGIAAILTTLSTLTQLAPDDDGEIEKAMAQIDEARVALRKADVTPARRFGLIGQLDEVGHALQRAHMNEHSVGFRKSERNREEEERLRARNFGRAA
jgi:hypothetical protein